jgi:predicted extracellular nuclease
VRIATFNVENLFTRYRFARGVDPLVAKEQGFTSDDLRFRLHDAQSKRLTADVIEALKADVVCLQEVEDLGTLKNFRDRFLGGPEVWPHALVIDGNDDRLIDVGLLSKWPIVHARSWQHLREGGRHVFDRDCLEADVEGPLGRVTFYVNHFKSMRPPEGASGSGRALTHARRKQQADAVMAIVRERFGDDGDGHFVIAGDFNDFLHDTDEGPSAIRDLVGWSAVRNVVERLPAHERWTHYWPGSRHRGLPEAYNQLDYLLVSKALADRSPGLPHIERRGQPKRAERFDGPRFQGVGGSRPKASDHCPVVFELG